MGFHKSKWFNEYNLNKPEFYLRYVDDIVDVFDNEQDSLNFLNLLNNSHPNIKFPIEKQINHSINFLNVFLSGINNQNLTPQTYHKSTYTGLLFNFKSFTSFSYKLSLHIKIKLLKLCEEFCKEKFNIKLVFNSFKIKNYFSYKDLIPNDLKSFLVYKFTCANCSSSYIGETYCDFKTRTEEHIKKDNKSYIFKHLHSTTTCFDSYNSLCFKIIDKANSKFDLKLKKLYILTGENVT